MPEWGVATRRVSLLGSRSIRVGFFRGSGAWPSAPTGYTASVAASPAVYAAGRGLRSVYDSVAMTDHSRKPIQTMGREVPGAMLRG
jgi:hypothetical protein